MSSFVHAVLSIVMLAVVSAVGWAAVTAYNQDFESMAPPSPGALLGDNWLVFANVYDSTGTYLYGYGPYQAPNDGAAFCAIATGQGGAAQGSQQLSVYSDYNNPDHGAGRLIESNVFQEQTIEAADAGTTVVFTFDAKLGNLDGASEAEAFIKTLDPGAGYAITNHVTIDMTTVPATWSTYSIELALDAGLVGQILQFGFTTLASNYEASGIYYDNVMFEATLFVDGFESGDVSRWSGWTLDVGSSVDGSTSNNSVPMMRGLS
ncbi:MAG: hypothetical protein PVG53_00285 [Holophagae bacterium]